MTSGIEGPPRAPVAWRIPKNRVLFQDQERLVEQQVQADVNPKVLAQDIADTTADVVTLIVGEVPRIEEELQPVLTRFRKRVKPDVMRFPETPSIKTIRLEHDDPPPGIHPVLQGLLTYNRDFSGSTPARLLLEVMSEHDKMYKNTHGRSYMFPAELNLDFEGTNITRAVLQWSYFNMGTIKKLTEGTMLGETINQAQKALSASLENSRWDRKDGCIALDLKPKDGRPVLSVSSTAAVTREGMSMLSSTPHSIPESSNTDTSFVYNPVTDHFVRSLSDRAQRGSSPYPDMLKKDDVIKEGVLRDLMNLFPVGRLLPGSTSWQ